MKKTLLVIAALIAAALTTTTVMAADAPVAPTAAPATTATAVKETDPNKVMVKVNGMEMTQAQARLVIIQNIKNHKQMTPEEMVAYINNLEANAANNK